MRVTSLYLEQFRSFVNSGRIEFGQINVLIGPNNSGKSSILRALHLLQAGCGEMFPDVRVGAKNAQVNIGLEDIPRESEWGRALDVAAPTIVEIQIGTANRRDGSFSMHGRVITGGSARLTQVPNMEPDHFIVPYLSRRKTSTYQEDVRSEYAMRINTDMSFLSARLSRLANPGFPDYERYSKTCKEILGFVVTAIPSTNGQRPGVYLPNRDTIPIELMGEGVPNIVALLADLALSEGKVFLIEEPENDLHPDALKALLNLILESSRSNQFVVSTHSNIVVRHLAAAPNSRLFSVDTEAGVLPPVARIRTIEPTVEARLEVLRDLGYSFSDFDLWEGWLILEESSAERIIRDYLIPWFAPRLTRVRTVAAGGVSKVEPMFEDFRRLVCFTHLEEAYRNATWVRVDGDQPGSQIVSKLREAYHSWDPDKFGCFSKEQFEYYYPVEFTEQITDALTTEGRQARRDAKRKILKDVCTWLDADAERGRRALGESAVEVISFLKQIEMQLFDRI